MKFRNSFVSNSSSSSFVYLGITIPCDKIEEPDFEKLGELGLDHDCPEGYDYWIIGEKLARWSEGEGEILDSPFKDIVGLATEVQAKCMTLYPEYAADIKLIYGENYG